MLTILRYLLTGHCGNVCDYEWFRELDGTPVRLWVPEADCPVHDPDRWYHAAASFLVQMLRDFCDTMMGGVPLTYDEDVEEAVRGE